MSSKSKSITDLVCALQKENESLQSLKKLFNQACRSEFGEDVNTIHQKLEQLKLLELRITEKQVHPSAISPDEIQL